MSYRTIKRLFGETSLERKCRSLLGGVVLLLILISFFFYGYLTEKLVRDATLHTARSLVRMFLLERHFQGESEGETTPAVEWRDRVIDALSSADYGSPGVPGTERDREYLSRLLRPDAKTIDYMPVLARERALLSRLQERNLPELWEVDPENKDFRYLKSVVMQPTCLAAGCHPTAMDEKFGKSGLKEGELHSVVSLRLSSRERQLAINVNRAILLSFAIFTAILAMILAYVIVRYVIVKPVAHLKEVSEEIAAGNLEIRSNIQTGDEFQELSHAFNRMLRSLVSMQDQLRKVNTDLDKKLDELAQANMALFEMNRLKSEFLATISHELRTPMHSILGFSDLLAEAPNLDAKQQRWVNNIRSSGKILLSLISDILELAKLQAGKTQVNPRDFSLTDVIEGLMQMFRPLADKKNIALSSEVDPAIPMLHQDGDKLQQIVSNLLSNAIKFTPEGGRIGVACRSDRAHVVISVSDNGVGIAPEDQKLVFEKFRQAESGLTRHHGGTGLGLSIVREMTKLLGGDEVQLESELGRGSTFTIRIPVRLEAHDAKDLTLGDELLDFAKAGQTEVRFYGSKDRTVSAEIP
jgi:signal transduction histidine kinase